MHDEQISKDVFDGVIGATSNPFEAVAKLYLACLACTNCGKEADIVFDFQNISIGSAEWCQIVGAWLQKSGWRVPIVSEGYVSTLVFCPECGEEWFIREVGAEDLI